MSGAAARPAPQTQGILRVLAMWIKERRMNELHNGWKTHLS